MSSHLHLRNKESVNLPKLEAARTSENTDREDDSFLLDESTSRSFRTRKGRFLHPKTVSIAVLIVTIIFLSFVTVDFFRPDLAHVVHDLGGDLIGGVSPGSDKIPTEFMSPATGAVQGRPRKAAILASYVGQKTEWTDGVSKDWEIFRYENNNPLADLTVPRNQGREAMSYLTFIIDHYEDLPDYMLFFHGHYQSWHQLAPTPDMIKNLNLDAVDRLGWVSLRCGWEPSCSPTSTWLNTTGTHPGHHPVVQILPHFFRYLFPNEEEVPMPPIFAAPCCAQFAVSKKAALSRTKAFWLKARAPLLRDLTEFKNWGEEFDTWHAGVLYERMWHYLFGMPAFHCVPEAQCLSEYYQGRFNDGIDG